MTVFCQVELLPDLAVGAAVGDEVEDFSFPGGQGAGYWVGLYRVSEPVEQFFGDGGVEQGSSGCDLPDALDEAVAADLFEQVSRGAGHDCGEECLIVVVGGQDQAADVVVGGADVAGRRCRCRRVAGRRRGRRRGCGATLRRRCRLHRR